MIMRLGCSLLWRTISQAHYIETAVSTSCSSGYNCNGSVDPYMVFHAVTEKPADVWWASSIFNNTHPYHVGKSGYFANSVHAVGTSNPGVLAHQRPALHMVKNHDTHHGYIHCTEV